MTQYQAYNKKIGSWIKYEVKDNKSKILDVKQQHPVKPFKGIKQHGKRK